MCRQNNGFLHPQTQGLLLLGNELLHAAPSTNVRQPLERKLLSFKNCISFVCLGFLWKRRTNSVHNGPLQSSEYYIYPENGGLKIHWILEMIWKWEMFLSAFYKFSKKLLEHLNQLTSVSSVFRQGKLFSFSSLVVFLQEARTRSGRWKRKKKKVWRNCNIKIFKTALLDWKHEDISCVASASKLQNVLKMPFKTKLHFSFKNCCIHSDAAENEKYW